MQGTITRFTNMRQSTTQYSTDLGDLQAGDVVTWTVQQPGSDGLNWAYLTNATRNGQAVTRTDGFTVAQSHVWAWLDNIQVNPTPEPVTAKTPFTLTVDGYKPYSGELEKL